MRKTLVLLAFVAFSCTAQSDRYRYGLENDRTVVEFFPREQNPDPEWWVSSGAYFVIENKVGRTVLGELLAGDRFRNLYGRNNPVDTDGGLHPQNIFRLTTVRAWQDHITQFYFRIRTNNLSASPNRNASNGVLVFLRYVDSQNLYYAGIRVDGDAVIKKKTGSVQDYHTLASAKVYAGRYDRSASETDSVVSPNLLPKDKWIGLRAVVQNMEGNKVSIKLFVDREATGNWQLAVETIDDGSLYGLPFLNPGNTGIRTDFMDVEFHSFSVSPIRQARPPRSRVF